MGAIKNLYIEGNEAFYDWENNLYKGESPLSDHDREMWVSGYVTYYLNATKRLGEEGLVV